MGAAVADHDQPGRQQRVREPQQHRRHRQRQRQRRRAGQQAAEPTAAHLQDQHAQPAGGAAMANSMKSGPCRPPSSRAGVAALRSASTMYLIRSTVLNDTAVSARNTPPRHSAVAINLARSGLGGGCNSLLRIRDRAGSTECAEVWPGVCTFSTACDSFSRQAEDARMMAEMLIELRACDPAANRFRTWRLEAWIGDLVRHLDHRGPVRPHRPPRPSPAASLRHRAGAACLRRRGAAAACLGAGADRSGISLHRRRRGLRGTARRDRHHVVLCFPPPLVWRGRGRGSQRAPPPGHCTHGLKTARL